MIRATCIVLALSLGACAGTALSPGETGAVVNAPAGTLQGGVEGGVRVFRGIPYAMPPVGAARWKPPAPMPRWDGVR
ncbi:MAG TPA: carboxylesterase family protein, partial [Candidatus Binatia bacterium]|nr:carboxylesterase family protein [Candidatus Binatia bacterium]